MTHEKTEEKYDARKEEPGGLTERGGEGGIHKPES